MNVLVSGASGLIGSACCEYLRRHGHRCIELARIEAENRANGPWWNPSEGKIDLAPAGSLDAVVHLAGETIAQRWTPAAKERIRRSRVEGTRLLAETVANLAARPRVFVSASASGYYGDRGPELLDEQSLPGKGFLAQVCQQWEAATEAAQRAGIRVVHTRFGIVLSRKGGALKKILPIFRLGLGGRIGSGEQYWSWVSIHEVVRVIEQAITKSEFVGSINVVAPNPATNREFIKTVGKVLHRPAILPVPALAIRLFLGEMGRETLLSSFRVKPARLAQLGFQWEVPQLKEALADDKEQVTK